MHRILQVICSPVPALADGAGSASRHAAALVLDRLRHRHPSATVLHRDIGADPPPHVDACFAAAMRLPIDPARIHPALALSETLIGELEATDALVLATPMHNYTVPSGLKAWIDHVVRARRTFGFLPTGKIGLLADRPAFIITASGGVHSGDAPDRQPDFLIPYLRAVLATIGISDLRCLSLQGATRGAAPAVRLRTETAAWIDATL